MPDAPVPIRSSSVVQRGLQTRVEVARGHGGCLDVNGDDLVTGAHVDAPGAVLLRPAASPPMITSLRAMFFLLSIASWSTRSSLKTLTISLSAPPWTDSETCGPAWRQVRCRRTTCRSRTARVAGRATAHPAPGCDRGAARAGRTRWRRGPACATPTSQRPWRLPRESSFRALEHLRASHPVDVPPLLLATKRFDVRPIEAP